MTSIRQDMVQRAVSFLRHPKAKDAPLEKQIAFLRGKALTTEEITEALRQAARPPATKPAILKRLKSGPLRSEAVVAGELIFISGQSASPFEQVEKSDVDDNAENAENAEAQATKALEKVQTLLEEAGSSVSRVVSATIYVRDIEQDLPGVDEAWKRWIQGEGTPARKIVQTNGMEGKEREKLRVQIEVIASL